MTFADIVVFNFIRGWITSQPEDYKSREDIPLLKDFAKRMYEEPRVKHSLNLEEEQI